MSSQYRSTKNTTQEPSMSTIAVSSSDFPKSSPVKPMRPLTAYHIFFQIEREYIIQTTPGGGDNASSSIHNDHKSYQPNVPRRYANIKLSHDWYAGPGKRAKRKHRKSHGKIGFLELSRVVSQRWANLSTLDPETKAYVCEIARRELDVYKVELREYEERVQLMMMNGGNDDSGVSSSKPAVKAAAAKKSSSKRSSKKAAVRKQNSLPKLPAVTATSSQEEFSSSSSTPTTFYKRSGSTFVTPPASPLPSDLLFSTTTDVDLDYAFVDVLPDTTFSNTMDQSCQFQFNDIIDDNTNSNIDYSISFLDQAGHHIPSPSGSVCDDENGSSRKRRSYSEEESLCDPLFELELPHEFDICCKRRRVVEEEYHDLCWA
eukprot:scaffold61142_cov57-Cyclotella_meneghiniana.AAC.14